MEDEFSLPYSEITINRGPSVNFMEVEENCFFC